MIRDICERVAKDGPPEDELTHHLKKFRRRRAGEDYSAERRMRGLGVAEALHGGFERHERRLEVLAAVTPERVRSLAERLFLPANTIEIDVIPERTRWWMPLAGLFSRLWQR